MKATIIQHDIAWAAPKENRRHLDSILRDIPESDLVVLPEMFPTGFMTDPLNAAETVPYPTLQWMKEKAGEGGFCIAGSVAVKEDGLLRNRLYLVHPDGMVDFYDKHHLFTPGYEGRNYTPGDRRVIATLGGGERVLLQVCYDLRFPVFSRNLPLESDGTPPYDIAIYVASWPRQRIKAWDTLLRARAIENQCFVIGVNRIGSDPVDSFNGHSVILSPSGREIVGVEEGCEGFRTAEIDIEELRKLRVMFPVMKDGDASFPLW